MNPKADRGDPYRSPATDATSGQAAGFAPPLYSTLAGALWSVLSTFPIVAITALVFRFPVPFVGYLSGTIAVVPALNAIWIYGVLFGGLVLIGCLGAVGGLVFGIVLNQDQRRRKVATRLWALGVTTTGVLTLAVLDKIIGPW